MATIMKVVHKGLPRSPVYAPEGDVDPPDNSTVNSDDPSDGGDDENGANSLGGGPGTTGTNADIDVWQEFSEKDIDTSSRGQYDGGPLEAAAEAVGSNSTDERRSSSWTCSTRSQG
jgi:hypothetical protein